MFVSTYILSAYKTFNRTTYNTLLFNNSLLHPNETRYSSPTIRGLTDLIVCIIIRMVSKQEKHQGILALQTYNGVYIKHVKLINNFFQAHYTFNNLTEISKNTTKQLMELLNFLAENFLFIYMGISVFSFSHHKWDPFFTIFAFLGIVFGRLVNIYPLAGLINIRNV